MQTTPAQTLMLWIITAHLFIAIVAYEWLPATYRGGWILIIGLLVLGAFVNIGAALIIGLIAFLAVAVYFMFDLAGQTHIERQLLLLFIIPMAPLFLSAVRYNIGNALKRFKAIQSYEKNYRHDIFPLSSLQHFKHEFHKLLRISGTQTYFIYDIQISNAVLIQEMLGEDIWKQTQNKILNILSKSHQCGDVNYHFIDGDLNEIASIVIPAETTDKLPDYIEELKQLPSVKLKVDKQLHTVPVIQEQS
ncbi:hypothetical protein [Acinetobacter junii]|uniref:hypothetical protein n=1 Tax=Acinetobacter junii TaxID=40215 RepID=UPI001F368E92|nr:hypothetical protein [Acinetobacter junii]